MKDPIKRRDFIKTLSLTGASFALANPMNAGLILHGKEAFEIKNRFFTIEFDSENGLFSVRRSDESFLISGGTSVINSSAGRRLITSKLYKHSFEQFNFNDQLGSGSTLKILSTDSERNLDVEVHFSLYDLLRVLTVEVICKNVSSGDIQITSLEPVCVTKNENGSLNIPGVSKCITNGAIYYDAGMIHTFGSAYKKPEPYGETKGGKPVNTSLSPINETVQSWWNAGFFSDYNKEGLALGYIENTHGLGRLLISKTGIDKISLIAESVLSPGLVLHPGQSIRSDRFMITIGFDPYSALENYAEAVGKINKARTHSIINGWCSWFYTYDLVSENEVIRNAEFASRHLKPYGLEYIQVDEGFQKFHGDWEGNERFPHGMKWLADKIKSYGLKPGLWIAPYVVSEGTTIFKKNPDWLLKNSDGSLKRVGPWPDEDSDWARNENPKRYGLDITHPDAAAWLFDLMDTIANKWGYEMIKIDFVAWSLLSAHHFYDASVTPAQAYRKGAEIMRSAVGEKCHLLDCGPGAVSVGQIDSMRIELDSNYGYSKDAWKQYFLESSCSAAAAAKRYYFHKRTWINDADHICINLLSHSQAQAVATIIALSGGNTISGDRLTDLDVSKLEILKKSFPSFGEAARPVDLFDSDLPSVFALKIKKQFGEWTVAGFFNSDLTGTIEKKFPLERLWLDPDKTYLVYDFWKEKFIGEVSDELSVKVQPDSVTLLALHEKSGVPQFISTNRHILQGAIELENISWSPDSKTLSGISTGPLNSSYSISVYLPEQHPWRQGSSAMFHDFDSYSLKMTDVNIMRIQIHFEKSERVEWEIKFE